MAQTDYMRTSSGSTLLPVADGSFTQEVSQTHSMSDVHVRFLDADENAVTPTGGTVTIRGGLFEGQFLEPSTGGTIDATEVEAGDASYTVARFSGAVRQIRASFTGIAGAAFAQIAIAGGD